MAPLSLLACPPALVRFASAGVGMVVLLCGCRKKEEPPPPSPPVVEVHSVIRRDVPVYQEWIGSLDGMVNAEIRAQVTGYLTEQFFREGTPVRKGDLLFTLDSRPARLALEEARARLEKARAVLAKATLDDARSERLFSREVISASERDQQREAIDGAKADLKAQEAAVLNAELSLGFTRIVAPMDGVIGLATAQIGDLVGPNNTTPLTVLSQLDPIKATITVSEQGYIGFTREYITVASRARAEEDLTMLLELADGSTYPYPGRFFAADRQVNPATGALQFTALFPNPELSLKPGLFCRVRARVAMRKGALLVPQRAVIERQGAFQVASVDKEGVVTLHNVTPGERVGQLWVMEKGLPAGAQVVIEGVQKARAGAKVEVKPWQPPEGFLAPPPSPYPKKGARPMPTVSPVFFEERRVRVAPPPAKPRPVPPWRLGPEAVAEELISFPRDRREERP